MHIVVADDHPIILQALKAMLTRALPGISVSNAATADELMSILKEKPEPSLALVDFNMPGVGDMQRISEMRAACPATRFAIISGTETADLAEAAFAKGAIGFIPKSMAPGAMTHAILMMLEGGSYYPDFLMQARARGQEGRGTQMPTPLQPASQVAPSPHTGVQSQDGALVPGPDGSRPFGLTEREAAAIVQLVRGGTNKVIGRELGIEEVTVKVHLQHAYRKMGARNRADAVRIAMMHGLDSGGAQMGIGSVGG